MLRDNLGRRASDNFEPTTLFMNGTPTETLDTASNPPQPVHNNDLNDDIFGSAPNSPILSATNEHQVEARVIRRDHSDVPRLRSIHVTNGYREGVAVSKESHIQAGFDEGFSLGGEIGQKAGWILGVLEGIARGMKKGGRREVQKVLADAQSDLKIEALLGEEWFGMDGIWKYEVPGEEGDVTFELVAEAHPVLRKWRAKALQLAAKSCLLLEDASDDQRESKV